MDTYQGIKDQSAANEIVNLLITEYADIFNESSDTGCTSGHGGTSSREDLSIEIEPEQSSCPCDPVAEKTGPAPQAASSDNLVVTIEAFSAQMNRRIAQGHTGKGEEAKIQLDRKRKDYQSKNHQTIEDDEERCQSFDASQFDHRFPNRTWKSPPQRSNSDGNNEEQLISLDKEQMSASCTIEESFSELHTPRKQHPPHEIIITNSSDSVSTDDNTTTTATSTGATVCSVIVGQLNVNNRNSDASPSGDDKERSSSSNNDGRLFDLLGQAKQNRSGSCGSDCTENMNIPGSIGFPSDDDDEDSLSKSIASDCDSDTSSESLSKSSSNADLSDNNAECSNSGSSSSDKHHKQAAKHEQLDNIDANLGADQPLVDDGNEDSTYVDAKLAVVELSSTEGGSDRKVSLQSRICCTDLKVRSNNADNKKPLLRTLSDNSYKSRKISFAQNKRLNSIKRKLKRFEHDFEQENGYIPTLEQKVASSFARPLITELNSFMGAQNEESVNVEQEILSVVKQPSQCDMSGSSTGNPTDPASSCPYTTEDIFSEIFGDVAGTNLITVGEMIKEIQRNLNEKREAASRPLSLDAMTPEQIFDEKLSLQKALLRFEALYGRPNCKAERDLVRPVYDRQVFAFFNL